MTYNSMALRDQPYLPLYVQDFLTDEKLNECSASSVGVYIKLMCLMHKHVHYGKILLKQKDKQIAKQISKQMDEQLVFFSLKLAKLLPFDFDTILAALGELISEEVLHLEGDYLVQRRMVYDNDVSIKRAESGSEGGKKTQKNNKNNKIVALANNEANSEYEYVVENENEIIEEIWGVGKKEDLSEAQKSEWDTVVGMKGFWVNAHPKYGFDSKDYRASLEIARKIAAGLRLADLDGKVINGEWCRMVKYAKSDKFYSKFSIPKLLNNFKDFSQAYHSNLSEGSELPKETEFSPL